MGKPDWSFWKLMPEVKQWQACALALDIDPNSLQHEYPMPGIDVISPASFPTGDTKERFDKLVRLLKAHRFSGVHFTLNGKADVSLPEFAAWCVHIGQDIPQELAEKAKTPNISPSVGTGGNVEAIPGRLPPRAAGKLAIKAAWQIECQTKRRASAKDVMTLLQEWASSGKEPDVLVKSMPEKRTVQWLTIKGKLLEFTLDACEKALETWNVSRK